MLWHKTTEGKETTRNAEAQRENQSEDAQERRCGVQQE